jgi:histidinol-phosphate phosphatase family protein
VDSVTSAPSNDDVTIVIPTLGRPSLRTTLAALAACSGPAPREIVLVDDRRSPKAALDDVVPKRLSGRTRVIRGRGAGPAAARNDGWRSATSGWIAFLDDDVVPGPKWLERLAKDLACADDPDVWPAPVGAVAGRIVVRLPAFRRPTDWERNTAALEDARWITADLAYRRRVLVSVAGFDERFTRAYREDADLALRVRKAGYLLTQGARHVEHPVRPVGRWVSLAVQKGNADDALMRALHGARWRIDAEANPGRRSRHAAVAAGAVAAVALGIARRRSPARLALLLWLAGTTSFVTERTAPGPRDAAEIATMTATSVIIPPLAVFWWLVGRWHWRDARPWPDRPVAVLFDRDGTLIEDVTYNGDPARVAALPGAAEALATLRARGVRTGVVSNQSGIARGLVSKAEVDAVNARVEQLLGPFGVFMVCPHDESDGCTCRKPSPDLVKLAAEILGADPRHCVVVGDIAADVEAGVRAGARAILVPTDRTDPREVRESPYVAPDLRAAVTMLLSPTWTLDRR